MADRYVKLKTLLADSGDAGGKGISNLGATTMVGSLNLGGLYTLGALFVDSPSESVTVDAISRLLYAANEAAIVLDFSGTNVRGAQYWFDASNGYRLTGDGTGLTGISQVVTGVTSGNGLTLTLGVLAFSGAGYDPAGSAAIAQAASLQKSSNLSDLASASTARANLGLGTSAVQASSFFVLASAAGAASGVATLDGGGKVPTSQLPAAVLGNSAYQGTWNATTNTPTLASGTGTKGYFYKVSVAGETAVDGISQWNVGDQILFDGTTWDKIDGVASEVIGFNGRVGAVVPASGDYSPSQITGLSASLALLAPLASPTLTGVPVAPTAAASTNSTQLATCAFVVGQAGTATPSSDGTAAVGTSLLYARQDHVHPTDTSRAAAATAVTAVSIATANGVSGSSSGGTTPAVTISLGAITPTTVTCAGSLISTYTAGVYSGGASAQASIQVNDLTTTTQRLVIGYDHTNSLGYIDVGKSGSGGQTLVLNPSSGVVVCGSVSAGFAGTAGVLQCRFNSTYTGNNFGFTVNSSTSQASQLGLGYDITADVAFIQAVKQGTAVKPLWIQPQGGSTTFGGHIVGGTSAPAISAGAGAGTGPTIAITGTDLAGTITLTPGTSPSASATICTVTFSQTYPAAPKLQISQKNGDVVAIVPVGWSEATTAFVIKSGSTPLGTGPYIWNYQSTG